MANDDNTLIQAARAWLDSRIYYSSLRRGNKRLPQYRYQHPDNPRKGRVAVGFTRAIAARFGSDCTAFHNYAHSLQQEIPQ